MKITRRQLRRLINETIQEGMQLVKPGKAVMLDRFPAWRFEVDSPKDADKDQMYLKWKAEKEKEGFDRFNMVRPRSGEGAGKWHSQASTPELRERDFDEDDE
tara:strand:- start:435 stop:740 length:306 start_codon:yes stop_codon:yes gene_type:complete